MASSNVQTHNHVSTGDNVLGCLRNTEGVFAVHPICTFPTGTFATIIATLFALAVRGTSDNANALFAHRSGTAIVVGFALFSVVDRAITAQFNDFTCSIDTILAVGAIAARPVTTVVSADLVGAVRITGAEAKAINAFFFLGAFAATSAAAVITAVEPVTCRRAVHTCTTITNLTIGTATVLGARITIFVTVTHQVAAEGVWCRATAATIHTGTDAKTVPRRVTAIGIHLTDTGFTGATSTTGAVQFFAANRSTEVSLASQPLGALPTLAAAAISATALPVTVGNTDYTLTFNALLSIATRWVAGGALQWILTARVAAQCDEVRRTAVVSRGEGDIANIPTTDIVFESGAVQGKGLPFRTGVKHFFLTAADFRYPQGTHIWQAC